MNKNTLNARENRKAILRAVGHALNDHALTKVELISKCQSVHIDHNVLQMLKNAGVISSTRGRHSVISLEVSFFSLMSNLDTLAEKMTRGESYTLHQEKRVLTAKADLKAAFKRAKSEAESLREQLEAAQREVKRLSSINQALNEKLSAIKVILK